MTSTSSAISLLRCAGNLLSLRCFSALFLFAFAFEPHFAQAQSADTKGNEIAEIEVAVARGNLVFFGSFMCDLDSVCSFKVNDLLISFFPNESFVGFTLRSDGGATPIMDARSRENLEISYDERTETIPLYSVDPGGLMKPVASAKVRAKKQ